MYLFLAFLLVPVIEIALFVQVGGLIGLWPTLGIVLLTAVLGTVLVRTQGRLALAQIGRAFNQLDDPTGPLAHGAMILISGVLLLTPGFFTDAVGFALLVPQVREAVYRHVAKRVTVRHFHAGPGGQPGRGPQPGPRPDPGRAPGAMGRGDVIEGEYTEVRPDDGGSRGDSGWVRGPERH